MKLETRKARRLRERLQKLGVWIFLALFLFSIVGVAVVAVKR